MAVPAYKRQESKVQFLDTARDLEILTFHNCAKFPKRYAFTITNNIINLSISIYNNAKSGNTVRPHSKFELTIRKEYFIRANCDLQALISQLGMARDLFYDTISASIWCNWIELVEKEIKLINAVIRSDNETYKDLV